MTGWPSNSTEASGRREEVRCDYFVSTMPIRELVTMTTPAPPPNVPELDKNDGTPLTGTLRQRMEQHRASPTCASCHRVIDPIGLSLENFDPTGQYRIKDNGVPVDAKGQLYDGTTLDGPSGLINALLRRKSTVVTTFTESLATYALGRRIEYYDMPTVRAIAQSAAQNDYRMSSFIMGVVKSDLFQMRKAQTSAN